MSLSNAPGKWRWEKRPSAVDPSQSVWWRIHDVLRIESGPYRRPFPQDRLGRREVTEFEAVAISAQSLVKVLTKQALTPADSVRWLIARVEEEYAEDMDDLYDEG